MSNPLRCVVSREIIQHILEYGHKSIILHEILECGHPYTSIPVMESEFTAKRRRCAACGALACRKPVQSVKIA